MAGVDAENDAGWRDDVTGEPLTDEEAQTPGPPPDTSDKRDKARMAEAEEGALYMAEYFKSDADEERKRAIVFLDWQAQQNRKAHS